MAVIAIADTPSIQLIQFSMVWLLYHKIDELVVTISARGNGTSQGLTATTAVTLRDRCQGSDFASLSGNIERFSVRNDL